MTRRLFVLGSLLLLAVRVESQAPSDAQAYFQWMLAVTDDTLTPRMEAHLSTAGLNGDEVVKAARILSQFKAEEFGLEESYNNLPSVQAGRNDDTAAFLNRQDALIWRTVDKLRLALSTRSMARLDNRVEHEAKNMKVGAAHRHPALTPVSFGRPQRLGMTPNYTYYNTSSSALNISQITAAQLGVGSPAFPQWNAANLVDGNSATVGFSTDGAQAGTYMYVGYGANPQDITDLGIYMSASGSTARFSVYYSDAGSWTQVRSGFAPINAGWNYASWDDAGAHVHWILQLINTPGSGNPTINQVEYLLPGAVLYTTSQVTGTTSCPDGCPPLAKHVGWAQVDIGSTVHNTFGPQVYPTAYISVSDSESTVLPNGGPSTTSTTTTGGVNCTVAGNGFSGTPNTKMNHRYERALTQSYISSLIGSNGMRPEHIYCIAAATPPDFPGPDEAYPFTPSGQVVNIAFLRRDWPDGTPELGVPWTVMFPKLQIFGIGYYVHPTMEPDPSGCTMWDNGFRDLPLPVPLDPQP